MKEETKRIIEAPVKAPANIKKKVQSTLNTYRLIGDVASLYVDNLSQTLIGFADIMSSYAQKESKK